MERLRLAWLLSLALMGVGLLTAHGLAYRLVTPDAGERSELLTETGHGYLAESTLFVGLSLTVALFALLGAVLSAARRGPALRAPAWFALFPVLGFLVLEHLERLQHTGVFPLDLITNPTFVVGLVLQLPFAAAILLLVRALLGAAETLGGRLAPSPSRRWHDAYSDSIQPQDTSRQAVPVVALNRAKRGPPPFLR